MGNRCSAQCILAQLNETMHMNWKICNFTLRENEIYKCYFRMCAYLVEIITRQIYLIFDEVTKNIYYSKLS